MTPFSEWSGDLQHWSLWYDVNRSAIFWLRHNVKLFHKWSIMINGEKTLLDTCKKQFSNILLDRVICLDPVITEVHPCPIAGAPVSVDIFRSSSVDDQSIDCRSLTHICAHWNQYTFYAGTTQLQPLIKNRSGELKTAADRTGRSDQVLTFCASRMILIILKDW